MWRWAPVSAGVAVTAAASVPGGVHLGDVEDVGDAEAESGCGVGVGVARRCRACGEEHRRVDRDAVLALAHLVAGLVPGAVAAHVRGVGRCAKISIWLASEYRVKRLMVVSSGSSELPGWARRSLSVARRVSIELRASVFIWEAPFLSRDPTVPSPVVRGTVGDRRGSRRRRPPTAPETRQGQGA